MNTNQLDPKNFGSQISVRFSVELFNTVRVQKQSL